MTYRLGTCATSTSANQREASGVGRWSDRENDLGGRSPYRANPIASAERKAAASQKSPYADGVLLIRILVLGLSLMLLHLLKHLFNAIERTVDDAISIITLILYAQRDIELRSLSELNLVIRLRL